MKKKEALRWGNFIKKMAFPYRIDTEMQPEFWDAVGALCKNSKADISKFIKGDVKSNQKIVIFTDGRGTHRYGVEHFGHYSASTVEELIVEIVQEIKMWHNMPQDDFKMLYLMANKESYLPLLRMAEKSTQK